MEIVMILVPVMLILVVLGIVLFSWAVKSGQYDDLEGPAHRILYDDDDDMIPDESRQDKQQASNPATAKKSSTDTSHQPARNQD